MFDRIVTYKDLVNRQELQSRNLKFQIPACFL